ncbi:MAG: TrmH family RNA methyltransferase [Bradymonadia bacterium]
MGVSAAELEQALEEAIYDPDTLARDQARGVLLAHGTPTTVRALATLLDAPHKPVRRRAARLLSEMRQALVWPVLRPLLLDEEAAERPRVAAARVLTILADPTEPALGDGLRSPSAWVRRASATRAAPAEALTEAIADEDVEVVRRAAEALLSQGDLPDEALASAVQSHQDAGRACPEPLMRALARARPAHDALVAAVHGGDAVALDHIAEPEALRAMLVGEHRVTAAWAIAHRAPEALPALRALAGDPDSAIRAAVARALPANDPALLMLREDADAGVRWLAERAQQGAFAPEIIEHRLGRHAWLDAVSARPPYGIGPDDDAPVVERPPSALALCQTRFDVNLGTAVRSAEAAGVAEVWLVGQGGLFRSPARGTDRVIPVREAPDAEAMMRIARARGFQIVAVQQTPDSVPYHEAPWPPRPMFVMGAEDTGVPPALRAAADLVVEIPMFGVIDSLNVAAAATCVMFQWRVSTLR